VNERDRADPPEGLTIRPLAAADRSALAKLPDRVSAPSAVARFHGAVTSLSEPLLDHLLNLEAGQREAVVAVDERGIAGVARYARDSADSDTAEVAIDEWQHRGVARQMLRLLIAQALQAGITRFRADMLLENIAAQRLFAGLAPTVDERITSGHVVVTIDLLGSE
jgi:RimJ/RimL family protein N-acetyltransferase